MLKSGLCDYSDALWNYSVGTITLEHKQTQTIEKI